jgi:hypothetical protein
MFIVLSIFTKKVRAKDCPVVAVCVLSACINPLLEVAPENPAGKLSSPLIPDISWVPVFDNTIVNGIFLSPGYTSIFCPEVPKYASRNLTSTKSCSNGDILGVSISPDVA